MKQVGIGLIGAGGGFGGFIATALRDVPRGKLVAIADVNRQALDEARLHLGAERAYAAAHELIADDQVQLVIVATPPFTQFAIAHAVLDQGKVLFLEKPGAMHIAQLDDLVHLQQIRRIPATIDFVMRWNPLLDVVREVRRAGWIGALRSVQFTNYAQDESLPAGHWFWDHSKSGGIWIEHCVHFFDLYGELADSAPAHITATSTLRLEGASEGIVDKVAGSVCHDNGVLCSYFHAFNRPKAMERQQAILGFDRGFITIHGWVVDEVEITGWVDASSAHGLVALQHCTSVQRRRIDADMVRGDSRWHADEHVTVRFALPYDRNESYRRQVAAGLNDLLDSMADPAHRQRVTLTDSLRALAIACAMTGTASVEQARDVYARYPPDRR